MDLRSEIDIHRFGLSRTIALALRAHELRNGTEIIPFQIRDIAGTDCAAMHGNWSTGKPGIEGTWYNTACADSLCYVCERSP